MKHFPRAFPILLVYAVLSWSGQCFAQKGGIIDIPDTGERSKWCEQFFKPYSEGDGYQGLRCGNEQAQYALEVAILNCAASVEDTKSCLCTWLGIAEKCMFDEYDGENCFAVVELRNLRRVACAY